MFAYRERRRFTPEEYLAIEEHAPSRSEYLCGEIFSMTGGSVEHNQIVRNLASTIDMALGEGGCQVFVADMRLHVARRSLFTYPDLMVVCGELPRMEGRRDTLEDATLIVEVLSPSTQDYDRGEKFLLYQSLPSFSEYLTVSQNEVLVERYSRQNADQWLLTRHYRPGDELLLDSLGITLELGRIYRGVEGLAP
ncbi:MAG: Uma2 family endonuclease [Candidatus Eremiobacteraeota bacterium]|nr:Uma2 family endonuclease [Candidatus Eremiobacteraeota bacterium]